MNKDRKNSLNKKIRGRLFPLIFVPTAAPDD